MIKTEEITEKRKKVLTGISKEQIQKINQGSMEKELLYNLYKGYDRYFFEGFFEKNQLKLEFSFSNRLKRSAGITKCKETESNLQLEIQIGTWICANFQEKEERKIAGMQAETLLEGIQFVLEHELLHAYLFAVKKNPSCKTKEFRSLSHKMFGHTESIHRMMTPYQRNAQKKGIALGDWVSFLQKGKMKQGRVILIGRTLTLLVPEKRGRWVDAQGSRYTKNPWQCDIRSDTSMF